MTSSSTAATSRISHPGLLALGLALTFGLSASCSESPTVPPEDPETPCDGVTLGVTSTLPLSAVAVLGIGEEFGEAPAGWVTDGEGMVPFAVYTNPEDSTAEFSLPLHPGGSVQGGAVEVVLVSEDGALECAGHVLTIQPLEPSPGELGRFVSAFQEGIEDLIASYGHDPETVLGSEIAGLDPAIAPLVAAHHILDSPVYEDNLRAILSDGELDAIEAAMARVGLTDQVDGFFAALPAVGGAAEGAMGAFDSPSGEVAGLIEFVTPAYLSDLMSQRDAFEAQADAASGPVDEYLDLYTAMMSLSTGVFGATQSLEAAGAATASFGAITNLMARTVPELLPSELDDLELTATPAEFNEDSEEIGTWNLQMKVRSRGATLDANLLAYHPPFDHMLGAFRDDLVFEMMQQVHAAFIQSLDAIGLSLFGYATGDGLEFPPTTWMVMVDTGREDEEDYFDWRLEHVESWDGTPAFEFVADPPGGAGPESAYRPLVEGISLLEVGAVADRFAFTHAAELEASAELVVHPIGIQLDKSVVTIDMEDAEPGEFAVHVSAEVEFADDETLEWREENALGSFDIHDDLGHSITYHVPGELGEYVITAEAITSTGPRHDLLPPRTASVTIRVVDGHSGLMVFPDPACVPVDTEVPFMAFLDGDELPMDALTWEMEGPGSVSADGTFSSDEEGRVTISFEYHDPDSGEVHVRSVSFLVLESCGELSLESSLFTYVTECVSVETMTFLPFPWSTVTAAGWSSESGAHFILGVETDIRDEGEWQRSFDRADSPGGASGDETYWSIPTFVDAFGDEWSNLYELPEAGEEVLHLERAEIQVDGETVALFSGSFQLEIFNYTEAEEQDLHPDEWTITTLTGQFSGVPYSDGLWICP